MNDAKISPPKPSWTIPDLIDLEYLLHREGETTTKAYFDEKIQPWIDPSKIGRPDRKTMSRALWQWLEIHREGKDLKQRPGRAFAAAMTGIGAALGSVFFLMGTGAVMGLLSGYDHRTFNVPLLLAVTIGAQWLLLVLAFLGFLTWGAWRKNAFATLAQRTVFNLAERGARRTLGPEAVQWWNENPRMRRLFSAPALQLTQTAGIFFNLGVIAALAGCILFLSVRFGWETTPGRSMTEAVHQVVHVLSLPWAWAFPEWELSADEIEQSRINGDPSDLDPVLAQRWYPFLLAVMVVWGLGPRLLLWFLTQGRKRRAVKNHAFQERVHREWWRRISETELEIKTSGPADGAVAVLWGGVRPDEKQLHVVALQQLRVNLKKQVTAGGADPAADETAAREAGNLIRQTSGARVVVVAESWSLAPKDFQEFHQLLRREIGSDTAIDVLLIGLPIGDTLLTAPEQDEVNVWQNFAADLGDPAFFVRPCRGAVFA